MNQSPTLGALGAALAKAQGSMSFALKDSANPFFKSNYADLTSVWEACRDALSKNDLSVVQTNEPLAGHVSLRTTLIHKSGEWIAGTTVLKLTKDDAQGYGSASTYARRYALSAIVGVTADDDDGNAATGKQEPAKAPSQPKVASAPIVQAKAQPAQQTPKAGLFPSSTKYAGQAVSSMPLNTLQEYFTGITSHLAKTDRSAASLEGDLKIAYDMTVAELEARSKRSD